VKVTTVGLCAVAYVLGARAGKERYDQIRRLAHEAAERLESYGEGGSLAARLSDWLDEVPPASRRR
jgi:hypothetical protein